MSFAQAAQGPSDVPSLWTSQPLLSQVEIFDLPSTTAFENSIPLTVVVLKGSRWTLDEVKARIERTEKIFAPCELSFSPITLVLADHRLGAAWDSASYESYLDFQALSQSPSTKPIVFMIESEASGWYGAGFSVTAESYPDAPYVNTSVIMASDALETSKSYPLSEPLARGNYEVLAHELAHVLFNEHHGYEYDNIMSEMRYRNNSITANQCKKARAFKGI